MRNWLENLQIGMRFSSSHLLVSTFTAFINSATIIAKLIRMNFALLFPVENADEMWIWLTLARVQSWKPTSSNAVKNVRKPMKQLDQFVHPMVMCTEHCAKWKRKRVAAEWFRFRWKIVQPPPTAIRIVMRKRPHSSVVRTINSTAASVKCERRIAASTCSLYRWSVAWPRSRSKDVPECAHKTTSPFAVPTTNPTQMNAS